MFVSAKFCLKSVFTKGDLAKTLILRFKTKTNKMISATQSNYNLQNSYWYSLWKHRLQTFASFSAMSMIFAADNHKCQSKNKAPPQVKICRCMLCCDKNLNFEPMTWLKPFVNMGSGY